MNPQERKRLRSVSACVALNVLLLAACMGGGPGPQGLAPSPQGEGPTVLFDPIVDPVPEIPFPNDLVTVPDPASPTGLRVNIVTGAPTAFERATRQGINTLSGFGTFAPITVAFDQALDVASLKERHENCSTFENDAVYLLNLDPASPRFGEATCLDFGQGYFPILTEPKEGEYRYEDPALDRDFHFFANDMRRKSSNLLFEAYEEDLDCNGRIDPGEDTDQDGVLDHPNLAHPERFNPACPEYGGSPFVEKDDLVSFFEFETNTLLIRPIVPLEEKTPYAVVLTRRLTGAEGRPVRSPFPFVNHTQQTARLGILTDILPRYGLTWDDVAFAWLFTTQDVTGDLARLRQGLYGSGPFSWLASRFEPAMTIDLVQDPATVRNPYILEASTLVAFFRAVLDLPPGIRDLVLSLVTPHSVPMVEATVDTFEAIDYLVYGVFETPYLVDTPNGTFHLDRSRGTATVRSDTVPFWLAVPKSAATLHPPFPVALYGHGYTDCRTEMFLYMGSLARMGIATLSYNMPGHGCPLASQEDLDLLRPLTSELGIEHLLDAMNRSRARDLNSDGIPESGADFWTADTFHTRDMVRQTVVDTMRLIQILCSFDGTRTMTQDLNGDGLDERAGDFNADGVVEVGGPGAEYFYWGQSLGGIIAGVMAGIEPHLAATVPVSGGGGLADVAVRTVQQGTVEAVQLFIQGPLITGAGPAGSPMQVYFDVNDYYFERQLAFGSLPPLTARDVIVVENLANGETRTGMVWEDRVRDQRTRPYPLVRFRVPIPADAGDPLIVRVLDGHTMHEKALIENLDIKIQFQGRTYEPGTTLRSPATGYGIRRNSPDMRRLLSLAQMILEPGDPINYARYYFSPLRGIEPGTGHRANVLVINTIGDMNVPIDTGIALARAAGLIESSKIDPRFGMPASKVLIDHFVPEGIEAFNRFGDRDAGLFDVDDLDGTRENFPGTVIPTLTPPLRLTRIEQWGSSGVRFPLIDTEGAHTFLGPSPWRPFDIERFLINQIAWYFYAGGRDLLDDPCLADNSCGFFPTQ